MAENIEKIVEKPDAAPIQTLLMGLDYYGSGNIGDDLMVGGFLEALKRLGGGPERILGLTQFSPAPLQRRFPSISWHGSTEILPQADCWAGVGSTVFQLTSGPWQLDYLRQRAPWIRSFPRRVLVNVGAEREILRQAGDFQRVAQLFDHISTRDRATRDLLCQQVGVEPQRLTASADLANLALSSLSFSGQASFDLGLILAGDTLDSVDLEAGRRFLQHYPGQVVFIAGETRAMAGAEREIYRRWRRHPLTWLARRLELLVPPYEEGSLADLVAGISRCRLLLSARYHGLLSAAWAGCRVGAICRSSKVGALAEILEIPAIAPPLTPGKLTELSERAIAVPRDRLEALAREAVGGVQAALQDR